MLSKPTYLENFNSLEDVIKEYEAPEDALTGAKVYLAWYGTGNYEGSSFVLFEKDNKLFQVNGSHCSCHGLEGQWEPEETTWKALAKQRVGYSGDHTEEAQNILNALVAEHLKNEN